MKNRRCILGISLCLALSVSAAATTYYVDKAGNEAWDGRAAVWDGVHGPKAKIQSAVDLCADGDTVKVAAGVYGDEQGFYQADASYENMRVVVKTSITLEGAGRDTTIIEGAFDTAAGIDKGWCGTGSVGGIVVAAAAKDTKIVGFTIRTCSDSLTTEKKRFSGTAVRWYGGTSLAMTGKPWLVGCAVSNIFTSSTPVFNVNVARTYIGHTYGVKHTLAALNCEQSAIYNCNAIHCVFSHCGDHPRGVSTNNYTLGANTPISVRNADYVVNCSWVRNMNAATPSSATSKILGCVLTEHYNNSSIRGAEISDCVLQTGEGNVTATTKNNNAYSQSGILAAPLLEDFRPVATADGIATARKVVGRASASNLEFFPEEYRWIDYEGTSFTADADGKICAGAIQTPITPVAGFRVNQTTVDGASPYNLHRNGATNADIFVPADEWPRAFELGWDRDRNPTMTDMFFFQTGNGSGTRVPTADGRALYVPRRGTFDTGMDVLFPTATTWVKTPENGGSDTTGDGTAAKPYATIQQALNRIDKRAGKCTLIKVGPGDYATGGAKNNDALYRVLISSTITGMVAIVSTDGAAATTIRGQRADAADADEYGYGASAVRGVFMGAQASCYLRGFTIADATCKASNDPSSAALFDPTYNQTTAARHNEAVDCVLTNCLGGTNGGGVSLGVWLVRSRVVDCLTYGQGMLNNGRMVNCLVRNISDVVHGQWNNNVLISNGMIVQGSTLVGDAWGKDKALSMLLPSAHTIYMDSIVCQTRNFASNNDSPYFGMVFWRAGDNDNTRFPEGVCRKTVSEDPGFIDFEGGDLHLVSDSPAVGWGMWGRVPGADVPSLEGCEYALTASQGHTCYYDNITYDLDGNKPVMVRGKGVAGAFQTPAAARFAYSLNTAGGVSVTGVDTAGTVPYGTTVSITIADGARHVEEVRVDGEPTDQRTLTLEFPAFDPTAPLGHSVEIFANTNWYVDAVGGNDANTGWSESAARKTLSAAMALAEAGDTVIALPGVYESGTMLQETPFTAGQTPTLPSRVVIPENVRLVSRDGAASTVIAGRIGSGFDTFWADYNTGDANRGMADDNVRCVYMLDHSELVGFTLRDGGVNNVTQTENGCGGAVFSATPSDNYQPPRTVVRACRIEHCHAALYHGGYFNCQIVSNLYSAAGVAGGVQPTHLHGCLVAHNRGETTFNTPLDTVGCTFSDNLIGNGTHGGYPVQVDPNMAAWRVVNCVFHQSPGKKILSTRSVRVKNAWNCVVPREDYFYSESTNGVGYTQVDYRDITVEPDFVLDEDYAPAFGSAAIDGVTNATYLAFYLPKYEDGKDVWGGQRVYNGARDLGAVEKDWRPRYATVLGGGTRHQVTAASTNVVEVETGVQLTDGQALTSAFNALQAGARQCEWTIARTGAGTLTVSVNGGEPQIVASETFSPQVVKGANTFAFAYTGDGSAVLQRFAHFNGTVLIFR